MPRLLRCRFWKSRPSRGPPMPSPSSHRRRHLDLDDLGAPVGELAHGGRSGAHARQVEDGEMREGGRGWHEISLTRRRGERRCRRRSSRPMERARTP